MKLLLFPVFILCSLVGKSQEVSLTDYAIYKSILLKNHQRKIKPVVIINKTPDDTLVKQFLTLSRVSDKEYNDSIWKLVFNTSFDSAAFGLYQLFEKFKPKVLQVKNNFNWPRKVNMISSEEIKEFFSEPGQSGFDKFYLRFPNVAGCYKFSEVLYSANHNFAMLYYELVVNSDKGNGRVAILKNEDDVWKVKYESDIWTY